MVGSAMTELSPVVGVSVGLRKEDMVGNALTELSPVDCVSVMLRKEHMVGSAMTRVISHCWCVSGAQGGRYGR